MSDLTPTPVAVAPEALRSLLADLLGDRARDVVVARGEVTVTVAVWHLDSLIDRAPGVSRAEAIERMRAGFRDSWDLQRKGWDEVLALLQSLGDLARLHEPAFKLTLETLDAAELLDDIALRFAARAQARGVTLLAEPPHDNLPTVAALDIELFERAVANLVDNALKFCPAGGRITLSAQGCVDPAPDDAPTHAHRRVEVRVSDTGPGIAASDLAHLFDRFYRVDPARQRNGDGAGLGLAIVKSIAQAHGGAVQAHSDAVLTCFELTLPRARSS